MQVRQILDELPALSRQISIDEVNLVIDRDRAAAWGHANVAIVIAKRPFLQGEDAPWLLVEAGNYPGKIDRIRQALDA